MSKIEIGILVGSLREGSFSKKVANALIASMPKNCEAKMVDISALPIYNEDLETENPPKEWAKFRKIAGEKDAFVFVTPEYNRSVPACIKNALDVGSRPMKESLWNAKPGAIISVSPGRLSGFGANHHLRQSMTFLNVPMLQQPEMYLGEITLAIDKTGNLTDKETLSYIAGYAKEIAKWVETFVKK